jgi:polar amino acid transport system substrate-binding protein
MSLLLVSGCSKEDQSKLIKVAVSPAIPPMLFEKDGKYSGIVTGLYI